ncbi:MAG: HDOD domain-containing protein [Syntrophobacteraceae bacterium]
MDADKPSRSFLEIVKECAASERLKLPVFPEVALELHQLLADPDVSVGQVAKAICKDQGLTTQIMKLANSGFYRGIKGVRTVDDAIFRLGMNNVFNHVVAIKQGNYYRSSNPLMDTFLKVSFTHAICTATGSQWLAPRIGYQRLSNAAFLAGLLHDIGKLLIIKVIESLISICKSLPLTDAFISDTIVSLHAEFGHTLMREWGILDEYCKVARYHHVDEFDTSDALLMTVRVANQACVKYGVNTISERQIDLRSLKEVQILGIKEDVVDELENVIASAIELHRSG